MALAIWPYYGPMQISETCRNSNTTFERIGYNLEEQGYAFVPQFLSESHVSHLLTLFQKKIEDDAFHEARVGTSLEKTLEKRIRKSETAWIEDWSDIDFLSLFYAELMSKLNLYFFLSLKRWESQFAFYPRGGFYRKHLDQLRGERHRQITSIFYLNDCVKGGELIIYDREDKGKVALTVSPRLGDLVIFQSSQIFHEVKEVYDHRFSLTTWFRDDSDF